ncbi:DUF2357 domain-containing protein [Pontiella sulfatireligans]|uniref:DUF2357 domain-containing protein n=1 Tax=Pontiella sulfatireligans TaxID=2750658 RepID=A0A6C2UP59_9BACT|nr:DUF2357 domain-containing protein [Pontiella sulfatireligans]VGO22090.1 hypothetical protein SCARR_04171 [Pontiella sulfatireligans]
MNNPSIVFPGTPAGLKIISAHTGERVSELEENGRYEYEVLSCDFELKEKNGIIRRSRIADASDRGSIEPGNYVGLLKLELLDKQTGAAVSTTHIDVRSTKLGYEDEYRSMLEDIADRCADFLLQLESPVEQPLIPDGLTEATLAQRLYFLKSLLGGEDFQQAVQRIITMPNTQWREEFRTIDVLQSRRLGRYEVRQFASAGRRMEVPDTHALHSVMTTIPERIEIRDKRDTVDTPENRFVKHALNMFLQILEDLLEKFPVIGNGKYPGLRTEIDGLINDLEVTISHDVFKQVALPELLPLNSPVLQRKEGYRQVLRAWMLFELAARLSWDGGDDVYEGGKRDVAALYEYWVFFKLLDLVAGLFELKNPPVEDLINDKDLVLKLKAGKQLPIRGVYTGAGRRLHVEFSYNRTFGVAGEYPAQGSWSRQMRPDYTLSLWPDGFTQAEAEEQELITHVHFDAKYKVDSLTKLFGKEDEDLDEEKSAQRSGNYKRADLLKMHAYRDAIRRSAGAYVLYPGSEKEQMPFRGFHELLPGLGAFPLRPNDSDDGSFAVERFFKEVVAHVCNRTTQREQQTYHTYRIHKDEPPDAVREALPEWGAVTRSRPSAETYVLHGWLKGPEYRDWVESSSLYNFRTESRGSLRLHESVAGASYLLLHGSGDYRGGGRLYRITSAGPRVFSSETLLEKGYPKNGSQPYYLVYDVAPLDPDDPLFAYDWDLSKIEAIGEGHNSAIPEQGIPLSDLMVGARRKR